MKKLAVLIGLTVLGLVVAASANLLTNPGFETGDLAGWDGGGWYTGTGADAHSGTYGAAYHVPAGRTDGDYYVGVQYVSVTEGAIYDASIWLRTVIFNTSESFMEVVFHDNVGGWLSQTGSTPVSASQDYSQNFLSGLIAPAGAVTASVRMVVHTTGLTADNAWHTFDDASFVQSIPEPATMALGGIAVGIMMILRRRTSR